MFRWCAYCLRFLGQRAPYDDFSPTHGICSACEQTDAMTEADVLKRVRPLYAFHRDLLAAATKLSDEGDLPSGAALIARGAALGIAPLDLSMGLLQPLLYEVGRLWETGALSHRAEARFTSLVNDLLDALLLEQQQRRPNTHGMPLILTVAIGNRHTIGIRMLGLSLREAGRDVRVIHEPVAIGSLLDLAELVRPALVGVSISEPAQISYLRELRDGLDARRLVVRTLVGGFGAREIDANALPTGVEPFSPSESPDWLQDT